MQRPTELQGAAPSIQGGEEVQSETDARLDLADAPASRAVGRQCVASKKHLQSLTEPADGALIDEVTGVRVWGR